ncbi:amidase [Aerosakkonema funiforme]|uniref:Amidase n=2 Tax=Oscillatoriophycideae TaxID=1301283 RepID=A0A926VLE0_9CYAN|nr:amidase [Aerosakkonema funiforme]MBD2184589.1 amidase [Aerosakkonema funiforme FACHB-1375]
MNIAKTADANLPLTITEAGKLIRKNLLTSQSLVKHYLDRIATLNPTLNAFITVTENQALQTAAILDAELKAGKDRGKLHGIPIVIKDNMDTSGIATTVGSKIFRDRIPNTNATIIDKLRSAGAILLGKTNLSELAADVSGRNIFFGDTHNAWKQNHSPGGSSSGTASAIAAHLCLGGIGSDTGGSIRIPASWSGIVGLRPTYGAISLNGIFPRVPSFDTVGPMANCVADAIILWNAIADSDKISVSATQLKGLRLATIKNYSFRGVDREVAEAIYRSITLLKQLQIEIVNIEVPFLEKEFDVEIYNTICNYEFYQILQNYIGNPDNFGEKVRKDLEKGMKIAQSAYAKAQEIRRSQTAKFLEIFTQIDALLVPTTPTVAPLLTADSKIFQFSRRFILPFSFTGVPAISVPCGFSQNGLPIGLQIIGPPSAEAVLLKVAAALEKFLS